MLLLPIDNHIPHILSAMERASNFILKASPGSGKTTRLPPALLQASFVGENEEVWVLEPRRLAAKWAAHRIAEERGEKIGKTVGYQFRWEKVFSSQTRLLFLTEGTFLKRLEGNAELHGVRVVMLDEFHERHLQTDVALAYLLNLQRTKRPDLKLVLCSATIDTESLAGALGSVKQFEIELPRYEVEIRYVEKKVPLEQQVSSAVIDLHKAGELKGHTLVFLPGMSEMKRAAAALENRLPPSDFTFHFLHGDLDRAEQDRAIAPSQQKKIIFSTNIAESSLTIEGVGTVIDSGLFRELVTSPWSGIPTLRVRPTSRASATQRAGRAGRTGPGLCVRLFSKTDFDSRAAFEVPEIRRADLTETVLSLKGLDRGDPSELPWIEKPDAARLASAGHLLFLLGALQEDSLAASLTSVGKQLARLPLPPRLARFLIECEKQGVLRSGISLASYLSEGKVEDKNLVRLYGKKAQGFTSQRVESQLLDLLNPQEAKLSIAALEKALSFSLLVGFPDRVAKRKKNPTSHRSAHQKGEEVLLSEGGVALWEPLTELWENDYLLVLDVQETQRVGGGKTSPRVWQLVPLEETWLFDVVPSRIVEKENVQWDSEKQRVVLSSAIKYASITLLETKGNPAADRRAAEVLLEEGLQISKTKLLSTPSIEWPLILGNLGGKETLESLLVRISLVETNLPELSFRVPKSEEFWDLLSSQLAGVFSLTAAKEIAWGDFLVELFSQQKSHFLSELVPLFITLPLGRKVSVHYERGKPPWVESRLQDFFGCVEGPKILKGRVPLVVHLLAPNKRPVQVTSDLKSFWSRSYPEIRTQLARRYPRHSWPENPLAAK